MSSVHLVWDLPTLCHSSTWLPFVNVYATTAIGSCNVARPLQFELRDSEAYITKAKSSMEKVWNITCLFRISRYFATLAPRPTRGVVTADPNPHSSVGRHTALDVSNYNHSPCNTFTKTTPLFLLNCFFVSPNGTFIECSQRFSRYGCWDLFGQIYLCLVYSCVVHNRRLFYLLNYNYHVLCSSFHLSSSFYNCK